MGDEIIGKERMLSCRDKGLHANPETVEMALDYMETLEAQVAELEAKNLVLQDNLTFIFDSRATAEARVKELEGIMKYHGVSDEH